jgi:hypothetical protein
MLSQGRQGKESLFDDSPRYARLVLVRFVYFRLGQVGPFGGVMLVQARKFHVRLGQVLLGQIRSR